MRKLKYFALFGIILSLGIASNIANVSAVIITDFDYATADTYIIFSDSSNYGTDGVLIVGNYHPTYYRSYLTFDLSAIPSNCIKAEISLYFVIVRVNITLNVNLADSNWGETSLNGSSCSDEFTADVDGSFITTLKLTNETVGSKKILVTDFIKGKTTLSINLEPEDNTTYDTAEIYSREEDINIYKPKITWTYDATTINPAIIAGFVVLGIFGVAVAGYFVYKKRASTTIRSAPEPEPFSTRRARKSDKICWYCEKPIPKTFNVCPNCGAELE